MTPLEQQLSRIEAKLDRLLNAQPTAIDDDMRYLASLPIAEVKRIQREKFMKEKRK